MNGTVEQTGEGVGPEPRLTGQELLDEALGSGVESLTVLEEAVARVFTDHS